MEITSSFRIYETIYRNGVILLLFPRDNDKYFKFYMNNFKINVSFF